MEIVGATEHEEPPFALSDRRVIPFQHLTPDNAKNGTSRFWPLVILSEAVPCHGEALVRSRRRPSRRIPSLLRGDGGLKPTLQARVG